MKLAYFVQPHLGGTYTLFRQLHAGLKGQGIDLQWVGMRGDNSARSEPDPDDLPGIQIANGPDLPDRQRAGLLIAALLDNRFDGVFVNVLADRVQMNIARYLPASLLRVMIVHNITPATYAAAGAIRDHVHSTVGVSQRCRDDLVLHYGFPPDRTVAIPNGIDLDAFQGLSRRPRAGSLRLLFLGRIEDASKGVFWLPAIMDVLPVSVRLTIAGDGPDLPALRQRLSRHIGRVRFLGGVPAKDVPSLLASHDVMIMPSRFEGFGLTLVEAMAAGCVPVASRIGGVTDQIVEHEKSGLLFPVGDWRRAAEAIARLDGDPRLQEDLSRNARNRAYEAFGLERFADAYRQLIRNVGEHRPAIAPPLPLDGWNLPKGLRPGLRTYLPSPIKNWLRVARERFTPMEAGEYR